MNDLKIERVVVLVTEKQKKELVVLAKKKGISVSSYINLLINKDMERKDDD